MRLSLHSAAFGSTVAVFTLLGVGCNTLKDAKSEEGEGRSHVYMASFEDAWGAMPSVIAEVGLDFISASRDEHCVLGQKGLSAFSMGENVAVFVRPRDQSRTNVEVVSKKSLSTNIFATNWSGPIFRALDKRYTRGDEPATRPAAEGDRASDRSTD